MPQDVAPLNDEERAELERLRAEKAAREERERARRERAELEKLRAQSAESAQREAQEQRDAAYDARTRAAKERASKFMEPGDDLSMPLGQKIVLIGVALVVVAIVVAIVFGHR